MSTAGTGVIGFPSESTSSIPLNATTLALILSGTVGRASATAVPVPSREALGQAFGPDFSSFDSRHLANAPGWKENPLKR